MPTLGLGLPILAYSSGRLSLAGHAGALRPFRHDCLRAAAERITRAIGAALEGRSLAELLPSGVALT